MLRAEAVPSSAATQRHATSTIRAVGRRAVTCVYSAPGGFSVRRKATIASRSAGAIRLYQAKGIVRLRSVRADAIGNGALDLRIGPVADAMLRAGGDVAADGCPAGVVEIGQFAPA